MSPADQNARIQELERELQIARDKLEQITMAEGYPSQATAALGEISDRQEFFRRVVQTAINGVYVYDAVLQRNVYVSPRYTELTGYTLAEVNGLSEGEFLALFHPKDLPGVLTHIGEVMSAGDDEVLPMEYRFKTRAGPYIWLLSHDVVFDRTEGGEVRRLLGSFVDITDQKRVQDDVEQFAHIAAHDLREPARRIKLFADLILQDVGSANSTKLVETVHREADRMLTFISDFRYLTSVGSGDAPKLERVDMNQVVAEIVEELGADRPELKVTIDPHPEVEAYPTMLRPLYRNLTHNALTHGPPDTQLAFTAERRDGAWIFGVRNTGSTIDPTAREDVFLPFRRLSKTAEGTGLGLSICKRIVDHHRGHIWIDADDNATHVRFCLSRDPGTSKASH